nr:MAG: twin-arginine translocase subunit TatC [Hyphomicrobiales bacterium]
MISPTPDDEAELDASKAPLLDHLVELRNRLINSILWFFVAFIVCFYFAELIYNFLAQPLADALADQPERRMIATALQETFLTYVKVGAFGALCLAFPFMASQLWLFIAPGLYRHERNAFLPFLVMTPVMFLLGASFVYYVLMPMAIRFFLGFEAPGGNGSLPIEVEARVSEYLSLVMTLIFAFVLCFQLPILLTLLGKVGIVTSDGLRSARRYAIVGVFVLAAVVTPPDVISQLSLATPLIILYEVSVLLVRMIEKKRDREDAETAGTKIAKP